MNSDCKGQTMKGQTSSEYVILITISILFFLIIIVIAYEQFANIGSVKSRDISVNSLKLISETAKEVYLQGSGAQKMVVVTFPPEVEDNSITIQDNSLHLNHAGTDISVPISFPIYGILPNSSGTYEILFISEGNQVRIGVSDFSVNPSSFTFSFCQSNGSQTGMQNITFTNSQSYPINMTLSLDWSYTNVTIALSNSSLSLIAYGSQIVTVTTNFGANVTGTFSGSITATTANNTITIPATIITLDCICSGGTNETCTNATCTNTNTSYIRIKTYSNNLYTKEKVAFGAPTNTTITTGNWSANTMITIDVKDPSNASIPGYPKNVTTNSTGGYIDTTPIVGPVGTYSVIVSELYVGSGNTTFNLTGCS